MPLPAALITPIPEIDRRYRENDPIEVRTVPGTDIKLRVLGWSFDYRPVIHGDDMREFDAHIDAQYKCHYCLDAKRVYLHGEEKEPDPARRGPGSPCQWC